MWSARLAAAVSRLGMAATVLLCLGLATLPARAAMPSPVGNWVTASHGAVIQIAPCGTQLCGSIQGMVLAPADKEPVDWTGQSQCGLVILKTDAAPQTEANGTPAWYGQIINPRNGSTYHIRLTLDNNGNFLLRGYVGLPLFGQTQSWSAYQGQLGTPECRLSNIPTGSLTQTGPTPAS